MQPSSPSGISGDAYFAAMSRRAVDRDARRAFTELTAELTPPGGRLFDFGCGPGIDAKWYANLGFKVGAYDSDPHMCESFLQFCKDEIAIGSVALIEFESYAEFVSEKAVLADNTWDTVVANFAPLNLVTDPGDLFRKFAAMLKPRGQLLISVLNPYFLGDTQYSWWWQNLPRLLRHGEYSTGKSSRVHRRAPLALARLAGLDFRLERTIRGLPTMSRWWMPRTLLLCTSQYLFMQFERV
jgi:2-polyprenyl-3-methyl-5-hydroxy-6-metoxy-1,4-benzoquinol methylase